MNNELYGIHTMNGISIPLTGVEVRGDITGRSAKVKIRQQFRNSESKALEAIYKFPLPEGSSVCGFRAVVGEKIIQGEIEEREKAFELYDEALARGDGAYLLDQERPNVFTLSLGNLNPGCSALIELDYVVLLDTHDSEVRFFLPTTISPRYLPPDAKDVQGIPADELVNPPIAWEVSYGIKINLEIQGKEHIQTVGSPSHNISTTFGDSSIKVELTSDSAMMDRDFVLNIDYHKSFETRGYLCKKGDESFIQLDFSPNPPAITGKEDGSEKEVIFVLDCSGSMQGSSITEAKKALAILLKALEMGDRFNIYRFGSTFSSLFTASVPYNEANMDTALKYVSRIDADLGGTEILAPLQAIQAKISGEKAANIILLTDGQVGNEEQIIDLVRSEDRKLRMFTVGIGNGPNEYFIKQIARITGGAAELISPNERIEPKVLRLFTKVSSAGCIQSLKVDWGTGVQVSDVPAAAFFGETVSMFAKLNDAKLLPEKITVSGVTNKLRQEWVASVIKIDRDNLPTPLLWARTKIRELEESPTVTLGSQQVQRKENKVKLAIIDLSKKYGIICRETSFVAVEKRLDAEKTTGEVVLRKVPVMLTKEWGGLDLSVRTMNSLRRDGIITSGSIGSVERAESIMYEKLSVPAYMRFASHLRKPDSAINEMYSPDMAAPASGSGDDNDLLNILALQKAAGGFEIDSAFAKNLQVPLPDLQNMALKIQAKGKPDKFVLLSTAIILGFLDHKYADKKAIWEGVVEKSRKWLERQISKSTPTIEGTPLADWANQLLQKQGLVPPR
jgi:Ca-activated chloride channel family protein